MLSCAGSLVGRGLGKAAPSKEKQVRRNQEAGTSRGSARGMLECLLLLCCKAQTHMEGGGNGSSHPPLLGHDLLQVSSLGLCPAHLLVKYQLLQSPGEIPMQNKHRSEITSPNRSHCDTETLNTHLCLCWANANSDLQPQCMTKTTSSLHIPSGLLWEQD